MAKWIYIGLILAIATGGVAVILKFGYKPVPQLVMSPSMFDRTEEIGATVFRRFYAPIQHSKIVVLGVPPQPNWHLQIVYGFLRAAAEEKVRFDVILAETQMPALDPAHLQGAEVQKIEMNHPTQAELIDRLRAVRSSGRRVLIYTASVFSAPVLIGNPLDRLERAIDENLFSITTGPLALRSDQEHLIDPPCLGSERDQSGTAALGCEQLRASRWFYRKQVKQDRWVAIMNSPRPNDYLLLVSEAGQKAKK